jgi:striatin 1/3/4
LSALAAGGSTINNVGLGWNPSLGRDPRGRAKSRDYLKQCLQEINYLTSLSTLNPLPEKMSTGLSRPRKVTVEMPVISHTEQQAQAQQQQQKEEHDKAQNPAVAAVNVAGNTVLPLNVTASQNAAQSVGAENSPTVQTTNLISTTSAAENILPNTTLPPSSSAPSSSAPFPPKAVQPAAPVASAMLNSHPSLEATNTVSESSPATGLIPLATLTNGSAAKEGGDVLEEQSRTAIFRPESAEEWRKALKKAGQAAGISGAAAGMPDSETVDDLDREGGQASAAGRARSDTLMSTSSSTSTVVEGDSDHKVWKARRALRA